MLYAIVHKTLGTAEIEAHRFVQDGSGTKFFDEANNQVASFYDGEISSVMPKSVQFTPPPPPSSEFEPELPLDPDPELDPEPEPEP